MQFSAEKLHLKILSAKCPSFYSACNASCNDLERTTVNQSSISKSAARVNFPLLIFIIHNNIKYEYSLLKAHTFHRNLCRIFAVTFHKSTMWHRTGVKTEIHELKGKCKHFNSLGPSIAIWCHHFATLTLSDFWQYYQPFWGGGHNIPGELHQYQGGRCLGAHFMNNFSIIIQIHSALIQI